MPTQTVLRTTVDSHNSMMCSGWRAPSSMSGVCECQKLSNSGTTKCQKLSAYSPCSTVASHHHGQRPPFLNAVEIRGRLV